MGHAFIYVVMNNDSRRDDVQKSVVDRINAIRPQLPADASITLGPNASSMGWIYQHAPTDREGSHDLRELRLLNESQIKPALQNHRRGGGGIGWRAREAASGEDLPAAAGESGHSAQTADRRPERVPGSRRTDDRGDEPRLPPAAASPARISTSWSFW
jgi:hypothetical protein